jgi:hypothetical protein
MMCDLVGEPSGHGPQFGDIAGLECVINDVPSCGVGATIDLGHEQAFTPMDLVEHHLMFVT